MSRQPTKEEIEKIFKQVDKDGSGHVSADELYDALGRGNFRKDEIALLVANMDKSGDGKIDIKEFLSLFKF